jgi:hypothetical protein
VFGSRRGLRPAQSKTVQAAAEDRGPAADLAQDRASADRSARMVQVAGPARAAVAGRASAVHQAPDHTLAPAAAFLELAFLEDLAEVAAPAGQDEA